MPDFLFELGCEELPASSVDSASAQLLAGVEERLRGAGLNWQSSRRFCTPRRLIVGIEGLDAMQAERSERKRGPALAAAFDADGNPTKALEGFCRGAGVDPATVEREGDYVWITKSIPGRSSAEVLSEILPEAIGSIHFSKTMRWGRSKMRFARPIRWILAVLNGAVVPFSIEGVSSGNQSRGHRFANETVFAVGTWDELVAGLRARNVEPDSAERERRIREGAAAVATDTPELTEALVEEVTHITEWPEATEGSFAPEHLRLPEPVLVTAMAKHEKFFPQRGADGALTNRFISFRNGGDASTVQRGNEWVLNARYNDAAFFYDEDQRTQLHDFLSSTDGMNFLAGLGNIRQRAYRLKDLAEACAHAMGASDLAEQADIAGFYAKADLTTGLVSELASLQGIVGAEYAEREGIFSEEVCWALRTQYDLSKNPAADSTKSRVALILYLADQLDKLAGCLGMKWAPKGSSDPHALRRAASGVAEVAWRWHEPLESFAPLFEKALDLYAAQEIELDREFARQAMADVMESRYEAMIPARHDVIQAALGQGGLEELLTPRLIRFRAQLLAEIAEDPALVQTMSRPLNILRAEEAKGHTIPADCAHAPALDSADGEVLWAEMRTVAPTLETIFFQENQAAAVTALKQLAAPIHQFFESTMINARETEVREARLGLVNEIRSSLLNVGDLSKLVLSGD